MSEALKSESEILSSSLVPVPIVIAAIAIIVTRCLGIALEVHEMGVPELIAFVHHTAQRWDTTLIFIAGQILFFIELRCALALLRGHGWGRWGYTCAQLIVLSYLLAAANGGIAPEIFAPGMEQGPLPLAQKLPDLLVLLLLFFPASSREFFRQR